MRPSLLLVILLVASCNATGPHGESSLSSAITADVHVAMETVNPEVADSVLPDPSVFADQVDPELDSLRHQSDVADETSLETESEAVSREQSQQGPSARAVVAEKGTIWPRLRSGFRLPEKHHPRIEQALQWYLKHPDYLERTLRRAEPFLHMVVDILEEHDVPLEMALLPIVESAYQVYAYSHGRASGLWQFIASTGRIYGLHQNWWYDGRRDVLASSDAAARHLRDLGERFKGDWEHALGAYNAGSLRISRAIKKNRKAGKPTDFWHLKLPRETRGYVPRLLALKEIFQAPWRYQLELHPIADRPMLEKIALKEQLDLSQVAHAVGLSVNDLYHYNPGFNRWSTPPDGAYKLLLPIKEARLFKQRSVSERSRMRVQWQRHRVRSGETLSHIARRYRCRISDIKRLNGLRNSRIHAGRYLLVPQPRGTVAKSRPTPYPRPARSKGKGPRRVHRVVAGDTLWDIARSYRVSVNSLRRWNGLTPGSFLQVGTKLTVYGAAPVSVPTAARRSGPSLANMYQTVRYRVRRGDSLSRIATRFGVSVHDIKRWNRSVTRKKYIYPGQRLKLHVDVRDQSG